MERRMIRNILLLSLVALPFFAAQANARENRRSQKL